jgi:hypothetical protein
MKRHPDRRFLYADLVIIGLLVLLVLAVSTIWERQGECRRLAGDLDVARALASDRQVELEQIEQSPLGYLLLYRRMTFARFGRIEPRWEQIVDAVWFSSRKWGVSPYLTAAKVEHESFFNPEAVGSHGEIGLMQILPSAWPQLDVKRAFDVAYNVDFGAMIFSGCMKRANGNIRKALQLYNGLGELPEGMLPYADRVLAGKMMGR